MEITLTFIGDEVLGEFGTLDPSSSVWSRLKSDVLGRDVDSTIERDSVSLPWAHALNVFLNFVPVQRELGFRLVAGSPESQMKLSEFLNEYHQVNQVLSVGAGRVEYDIHDRLIQSGFDKRVLTDFQLRDIAALLRLGNGANFSVPGAGKTTVTLALNTLLPQTNVSQMLVVSPKSAFQAWASVVDECFSMPASSPVSSRFEILTGDIQLPVIGQRSNSYRWVTNYEFLVNNLEYFSRMITSAPTHLVLDESHRIKAGQNSQRGAALLKLAPLAKRRDILSGTPMPQSVSDIRSQLDFLWPGMGIGNRISDTLPPRHVIAPLYVRTMKTELGLPQPNRRYVEVGMAPGQLALYGIVRSEFLRDASKLGTARNYESLNAAKRSVMRLLQISANPILALKSMVDAGANLDESLISQILEDGLSPKIRRTIEMARSLASHGRKVVIWTIFTQTIIDLQEELDDLGALVYYGAIANGAPDQEGTREWVLEEFHKNPNRMVLIANPAAAGEGISLHTVCHEAIYLDRSFVSTHYIQSIDRIHRLGLDPGEVTNIQILLTKSPAGLGSIDASVSRRLMVKLKGLQELLDDPDLKQLVLDEEEAPAAVDFEIELDDILDVLDELRNSSYMDDLEEFDEPG